MKKLMVAMGILALICSPAYAGRNANGAMLLHAGDAMDYSAGTDYCTADPLPPSCDGINTSISRDPAVDTMVWLVAAFSTYSSPGVNAWQCGLGGDVTNAYMDAWLVCGPSPLEIPDAGWPGAGTGDAVAYTSTVFSQLFKMYWFACGAPGAGSTLSTTNYYGADHHAEWADDSNPPVIDFCNNFGAVQWGGPGSKDCPPCCAYGACCFPDGTCQVLVQQDCLAAGGMYQGDNTTCVPNNCPQPMGACCFVDGSCRDLNSADCTAAGGTWYGMGTACASFQCPQPTQACCFQDGSCQDLLPDACTAAGGTPEGGGTSCDTFQCPPPQPTGACCLGEVCTIQTEASCIAGGGQYKGDGTTCEPINPCGIPVPTRSTSWGKIKASYR